MLNPSTLQEKYLRNNIEVSAKKMNCRATRTPFPQLHKYQEEILKRYPTSEPTKNFWSDLYFNLRERTHNQFKGYDLF